MIPKMLPQNAHRIAITNKIMAIMSEADIAEAFSPLETTIE